MRCKRQDCDRRAYSRGWCTTHYRRWRSGCPMDVPIRSYQQYEGDGDSNPRPVIAPQGKRKREKPFAAERALLRAGLVHGLNAYGGSRVYPINWTLVHQSNTVVSIRSGPSMRPLRSLSTDIPGGSAVNWAMNASTFGFQCGPDHQSS